MGLDQYAYTKAQKGWPEFAHWREHNRLQDYMERLYRRRGGTGEFNEVEVELTAKDLDELALAVANNALPETSGFFFDADSYQDYVNSGCQDADLKFIEDARALIADGVRVYYSGLR